MQQHYANPHQLAMNAQLAAAAAQVQALLFLLNEMASLIRPYVNEEPFGRTKLGLRKFELYFCFLNLLIYF